MSFLNNFDKDSEYYRQLIVGHYSNPINKGLIKTKNSFVFHHYSNSCVDDFYIELTFNQDIVSHGRFEGIGCAISSSSIDIFLSLIINKNMEEISKIVMNYQNMLVEKKYDEEEIDDLVAFKNVFKQPNRIKCALIISESITEIFLKKGKSLSA